MQRHSTALATSLPVLQGEITSILCVCKGQEKMIKRAVKRDGCGNIMLNCTVHDI